MAADPWQQLCACGHALVDHNLGVVPSGPRDCAHDDCDCEQFALAGDCSCCGGDPDLVCDACGQHSCWAGEFMCDNAVRAGVVSRADYVEEAGR